MRIAIIKTESITFRRERKRCLVSIIEGIEACSDRDESCFHSCSAEFWARWCGIWGIRACAWEVCFCEDAVVQRPTSDGVRPEKEEVSLCRLSCCVGKERERERRRERGSFPSISLSLSELDNTFR